MIEDRLVESKLLFDKLMAIFWKFGTYLQFDTAGGVLHEKMLLERKDVNFELVLKEKDFSITLAVLFLKP